MNSQQWDRFLNILDRLVTAIEGAITRATGGDQ